MSKPRDTALLMDTAAAAERIAAFMDGMDAEKFKADARTHLAVQHQIMIIAEAAKRLSTVTKNAIGGIPWAAIARMRDRLIHGYDAVDLENRLGYGTAEHPKSNEGYSSTFVRHRSQASGPYRHRASEERGKRTPDRKPAWKLRQQDRVSGIVAVQFESYI